MMDEKINKLLNDFQSYHSSFQIENFIIGSQGSEWFQYKQCLREVRSRTESIESAKDELALSKIGRKSVARKIKLVFIGQIRKQMFLKNEKRRAAELVENIRETKRELNRFVELAWELKKKIGELDEIKRQRLEADSWIEKARQMAAIEIMTMGGLSKTTMEFILSLPKESRRGILIELKSIKPETILQIE